VEHLAQQIGRAPTGFYNKLMNLRAIDPRDSRKGFDGGSKVDQATWDEFFDTATSSLNLVRLNAEYERLWGRASDQTNPPNLIEDEEKRLAAKPLDWLLAQYASRPRDEAPKRRSLETTAYDRDRGRHEARARLYVAAPKVCQLE